jgi:PAS domain S-box-containing protein
VEVYSGPIRVHEKHLLYSTVIDVTKRRSTERALRRSESRYRTIFENSRDGILIADTDTMRFTYANEAVCRLFGYSREELLELGVPDIHPAEELDYVLSQFELQKRGELKYSIELPCVKNTGKIFYCDVSAVPVELEEAPSLMGFFRDVSERRQTQQLRDDVDRIFQHDLRNPLNGIINYPQLLRDDENLTGRQRELLGEIENAGRNMLRMLNLSLDIFKMETGSFTYSPVQTDILAVIRQVIGHYRSQIEAKHLDCSLVVNGAEPAENERFELLTDENLFYSLVSNLLSNAVDASPNGEEVKIELREGAPHHLSIANAGAVPAEIRSDFFDKYKTTGKERGTGLGTYSARLIAENMGWDLRMETFDETNTTRLTLHIPAH